MNVHSHMLRIALAAYIIASTASCASHERRNASPITVRSVTAERRTIAHYESLDGQIDPFLQANLAPQQSGTLLTVYANEGDRVRKGQILAKIDDSLLRADLTQQQGGSIQSVAKLAQSKIQLPITDVSSTAALVQAIKASAQAKKTQLADAANARNTKVTYDADLALLHQGYVAESIYEQARAAYVAAQQTLASDDDKIAQDEAAVREARQNLANTPLQQQVIAENKGAVVQSTGSVTQYQTALRQTNILAPFDGVITARTLDPGNFASPSQAVYAIAQIDPVYVDFNVKDTDLPFVSAGSLASFTTSANPSRRYIGRVASVDYTPTPGALLYRARIIEQNSDFSLRGGLEASVRITREIHRNVLTVPRSAVIQNGTQGDVYKIDASTGRALAKQITVKLGLQTSDYVEISGNDVKEGTLIVRDQTDNLHDGAAIALPSPSPLDANQAIRPQAPPARGSPFPRAWSRSTL
jgi:HlyD family secretion protein